MRCPICGSEMEGTHWCPNCGYSLDKDVDTNGEEIIDDNGTYVTSDDEDESEEDS